jgi:hypothetical protein
MSTIRTFGLLRASHRVISLPLQTMLFMLHHPRETFIFLLLLATPDIIQAKQKNHPLEKQDPLYDVLNEKIIVTADAKSQAQKCENIKTTIIKTVRKWPHSRDYISNVLSQPKFTIHCSSIKDMNKLGLTLGGFNTEKQTIYYSVRNDLTMASVHHEFFHADNFYRHSNKPCLTENNLAPVPVYPVTEKNIAAYNKAFDAGDERINEFKKLYLKRKQNKPLAKLEAELYKKYLAVLDDCDFSIINIPISKIQYDKLDQAVDWEDDNRQKVSLPESDIGKIEVYGVDKEGNSYTMRARPTNRVEAIILTVEKKDKAMQNFFKNSSPEVQLGEREAMTFEGLSVSAMQLFYPEAYAMRLQHMQQCDYKHNIAVKMEL